MPKKVQKRERLRERLLFDYSAPICYPICIMNYKESVIMGFNDEHSVEGNLKSYPVVDEGCPF